MPLWRHLTQFQQLRLSHFCPWLFWGLVPLLLPPSLVSSWLQETPLCLPYLLFLLFPLFSFPLALSLLAHLQAISSMLRSRLLLSLPCPPKTSSQPRDCSTPPHIFFVMSPVEGLPSIFATIPSRDA